ncbi:MAG: hypothetical protein WC610_01185 [Patescibacteria group bacterium]
MNFLVKDNLTKDNIEAIKPASNRNPSPLFWGIFGALGISAVFYAVQALGMGSLLAPWYFFKSRWYFILPLIFGFAFQLFLFRLIHLKIKQGGGMVAASGGVSTTTMIACCLHHLTNFLPILGLSGLAVLAGAYQPYIFLFSILFNLGGIIYLWSKYIKITNQGRPASI